MKKVMMTALIFAAAFSPAFCMEAVEANLELTGLLSMTGGGIYGGGIQTLSSYGTDLYVSDTVFDSVGTASVDMIWSVMLWNEAPEAMIAPYFRFSTVYFALEADMEGYYTLDTAHRRDVLDVAYFGAGLKRYLQRPGENFRFYAGVDIGYFSTVFMNTNSSMTYYDASGTEIATDRIPSYRGGFMGGHAEAGAEYWFNDKIACMCKAGLRIGGGYLSGTSTSTDPARDGLSITQAVNTTGLYFGAGVNVALGYKKYPGKPGIDHRREAQRREELIAGGDQAYTAGDYAAALTLYDRALGYGSSAELLARLGGCLYFMGEKNDARAVFRAAESSQDFTDELKRWIDSAIAAADSQAEKTKGGKK